MYCWFVFTHIEHFFSTESFASFGMSKFLSLSTIASSLSQGTSILTLKKLISGLDPLGSKPAPPLLSKVPLVELAPFVPLLCPFLLLELEEFITMSLNLGILLQAIQYLCEPPSSSSSKSACAHSKACLKCLLTNTWIFHLSQTVS